MKVAMPASAPLMIVGFFGQSALEISPSSRLTNAFCILSDPGRARFRSFSRWCDAERMTREHRRKRRERCRIHNQPPWRHLADPADGSGTSPIERPTPLPTHLDLAKDKLA